MYVMWPKIRNAPMSVFGAPVPFTLSVVFVAVSFVEHFINVHGCHMRVA